MKKIKNGDFFEFEDPPSNDKFKVPPSKKEYNAALDLSKEILKNIEQSEISLALIALKTNRLARLLNDFEMVRLMELEISGYPKIDVYEENSEFREIKRLATLAGRLLYSEVDVSLEFTSDAIEKLENEKKILNKRIDTESDLDERNKLQKRFQEVSEILANRRSFIHKYITQKYLELNFSNIADNIFGVIRQKVDNKIALLVPDSVKRFNSAFESLNSGNSEDWSSAVHSCRRILEDLADAIYPPTKNTKIGIDGKSHKTGQKDYKNRIIEFITQKSDSETYNKIVGSHLRFIDDRLESILKGSQKGSHTDITDREEAARIVVYTYLLLGDILSLI